MKNALELYIEGLAALAVQTGKLPKNAASAEALRPVWQSLTQDIATELELRQLSAMAEAIIAASPKARAALDAADDGLFGPIREALDKIAVKTIVPSSMRSADWAQIPVQVREASQFSAGVASARVLTSIQERLQSDLGWDWGVPSGREAFIRDMRAVMQAEGVGTAVYGEGSLVNPQANSRLGMIYDQQTTSARGYAARKISMDPNMLDAVPAQELIREQAARQPRSWQARWTEAGGVLRGGRMAALKTDDIWVRINRFGVPWPPFDFGSHMGLSDLLRPEAEAMGLLTPADTLEPQPVPDYGAGVQASAAGLSAAARGWLQQAYGERLQIDGDRLSITAKPA